MTIERGEAWGWAGALEPGGHTVDTDAAAALIIGGAVSGGLTSPPVGLTGGDLWRTCGGTARRSPGSDSARHLPVDLGRVVVDGTVRYFVAHVIARRRGWWGEDQILVMNAAWHGDLNLGPRSHPNDGRLDVTVGGLPPGQRRTATAKARSGTHLPHPSLRTTRTANFETELPNLTVYVDGVAMGRARQLRVDLIADAGVVVL